MLKYNLDKIFDLNGGWIALNIGNYAMQLIEYKDIYEKGNLLILDFNELINDTNKCLEKIFKKLNIDINQLPINNYGLISNKTKDLVLEPHYLKRYPLAKRIYSKFPTKLTSELSKFYQKFFYQKQLPKRILTESEKIRLAKIYKPSLIQLKKEYGINFFETTWTTTKKYL